MGFRDFIKSVIGKPENSTNNEYKEVFEKCLRETLQNSTYFFNVEFSKIETYNTIIKKWDDEKKGTFLLYLTEVLQASYKGWLKGNSKDNKDFQLSRQMILALYRSKLNLSEESLVQILKSFKEMIPGTGYNKLEFYPLAAFLKILSHIYGGKTLPNSIKTELNAILLFSKNSDSQFYSEIIKIEDSINVLLSDAPDSQGIPIFFVGNDNFTNAANHILKLQKEDDKKHWFDLLRLANKAKGSRPSAKFLLEAKSSMDALGADKFKKVTQDWFQQVITLKETIAQHTYEHEKTTYHYNSIEFLSSLNMEILKGFVWISSRYHDNATIQTIAQLAERCFKKIPEKGPAAPGLGNACLYTLYSSKGLDGIAQLSRLRLKIKQANTLTLIEKYINEAAEKLNISINEIEDLAVDTFKLQNWKVSYTLDETKAVIELTGIGKSALKWFKADGSQQKSVPQLVKDKHAVKLKKIKAIQKQIDQATATQKERFDRLMRSERLVTIDYFLEKYCNHELFSFVLQKTIFRFSNDLETSLAIYLKDQFYSIDYDVIALENYSHVALWHPATSTTQEVKNWRAFLMNAQIQQPFKQAFREIYLLTEAEINTRTYSNRMAAHILKQHQYVTLAKGRNWKAKLLGAWDGGDDDTAQLLLPEYNLIAEFWVSSLSADEQYNSTGIWNYVTTDQIRFINTTNNELVDLINVPIIAFSEVMRDVDLFVGVASVGNDPTWNDSGGLPNHRNYWHSYSFGDLSELAKNRKEILHSLLPRLTIASVAKIDDKFLVVKGKLRTYKIHLGSTNILMEPNDQYLCIVPDRSKKDATENLFIPFEGDNGLSVIISKAFLLANDNKITDSSITSQINR